MANDTFKVKKALNIEPNTAPNLSTDGDIGFNSTDSNLEVYTGGSVKKVVTNSQTQTLTNKTFDVVTFDGQASAPANPSAGNYKVYVDDTTSKLQILDSTGTVTTVGTSAGGINYITNGDAEAATTGWATYADAAGTSPVDGTGGSPTTTFTRSTSSPLRGLGSFLITKDAANRQGEGASYAFSIADADKAKMMQIDFELEVNSGTYVTGDVAVYIYDVTNAAVIQPSGYQVENVGIESRQRLTFQTASNSTSYRLCFHVASTSASAYALKIDTITLGPQVVPLGAPVTDWVSYTPTGSWVTNTTYTGRWRRVGDSAEIQVRLALSGAPTAATLTVNLPSGMVIDTSKLAGGTAQVILPNSWGSMRDDASYNGVLQAYYESTTTVGLRTATIATPYINTQINATTPVTWAINDSLDITYRVPIVGWSSSTVVSSSADTRVVAASRSTLSSTTITSGTALQFTTNVYDTAGGFTSNSTYTVPVPGIYRVTCTGLSLSSGSVNLNIGVNGVSTTLLTTVGTARVSGTGAVSLNAGNTITIIPDGSVTAASAAAVYFYVERISGPSQIAASEVIAMQTGGTPTGGNTVPFIFPTLKFETHGSSYNAATGVFTCPAPGIYQVSTVVNITNVISVNVHKNGSSYGIITATVGGFGTGTALVSCNAGDTISIVGGSAPGAASSSSFSVNRLGGVM